MAAAARLIGEWLRRERRGQPVLQRDSADRLAHGDLSVGGLQHGRVLDRQLLLSWTELRIVLAWFEVLLLERVQDRADHCGLTVHAVGAEAQTVVGWYIATVIELPRQIELILECGLDP